MLYGDEKRNGGNVFGMKRNSENETEPSSPHGYTVDTLLEDFKKLLLMCVKRKIRFFYLVRRCFSVISNKLLLRLTILINIILTHYYIFNFLR